MSERRTEIRENKPLPGIIYEGERATVGLPFVFEINREELGRFLYGDLDFDPDLARKMVFRVVQEEPQIEHQAVIGFPFGEIVIEGLRSSIPQKAPNEAGNFFIDLNVTENVLRFRNTRERLRDYNLLSRLPELTPNLGEKVQTDREAIERISSGMGEYLSRHRWADVRGVVDDMLTEKFVDELLADILHKSVHIGDVSILESTWRDGNRHRRNGKLIGYAGLVFGGAAMALLAADNIYAEIGAIAGTGLCLSGALLEKRKMIKTIGRMGEIRSQSEEKCGLASNPDNLEKWRSLIEVTPNPAYKPS